MALSIDHIVIYVEDLQDAMETYRNAGFTVNYGGQHGDGVTENGLIIFADGTYLELIALVEGKTFADAGFKALLKERSEGFTGYALQSDDIEDDLETMREQGVIVGDIRSGTRARADGKMLEWRMALIDEGYTPFVIQDVTAREYRVPMDTDIITHANGARGIHELLIRVPNLQEAVDHFGRVVGIPLMATDAARFELGSSAIVLTEDEAGIAEMTPALLSLYTDTDTPTSHRLHDADFLFI